MTLYASREVTLNVQLDTSAFDKDAQLLLEVGTHSPQKVEAFLDGINSLSQLCSTSVVQNSCDVMVALVPSQQLATFLDEENRPC